MLERAKDDRRSKGLAVLIPERRPLRPLDASTGKLTAVGWNGWTATIGHAEEDCGSRWPSRVFHEYARQCESGCQNREISAVGVSRSTDQTRPMSSVGVFSIRANYCDGGWWYFPHHSRSFLSLFFSFFSFDFFFCFGICSSVGV